MNFDNKEIKKIIGLISFIVGILLITFSTTIPFLTIPINIAGALLITYGVLNLIDLIDTIKSDNKKIIGLISFIVGILLITFSTAIPLPNVLVNVVGALLMAYGVLNLVYSLLNHL